MSLIKCKECGKEISDQAYTCPHCGCPMDLYHAKDNYVEEKKEESFFSSTMFCVVMFLLVWPVGLFTMWKYDHGSQPVKIGVTILCVLYLLLWMFLKSY